MLFCVIMKYSPELLADSCNILNIWKTKFYQLLDVGFISYIKKIKMHTTESLLLDRTFLLRPELLLSS